MIDIIIAGVPKSGTSSLFDLMRQHPLISASNPKETRFLMDENHDYIFGKDGNLQEGALREYDRFFESDSISKYRLEGTTQYFYQELPLKLFQSFNKKPKIIFSFRRPSERIFSSFNYTLNNLGRINKNYSFSNYVDDLIDGNRDRILTNIHHHKSREILADELERSLYFKRFHKWKKSLGDENILLLQFEQMKSNFSLIKEQLSSFLEIDFNNIDSLSKKNSSVQVKNKAIHKYLINYKESLGKFPYAKKMYRWVNYNKKTKPESLEKSSLKRLDKYFEKFDNEFIEAGFDINLWKETSK